MRRVLRSLVLVGVVVLAACMDDAPPDPVGPPVTATQLGKKGPAGCLSTAQQALSDDIAGDIGDLFGNGGSRNAARQQLSNIDRKLCEGDYADALAKAFEYLNLVNDKFPDLFDGTAVDAAEHVSKIFALVGAAPNPNPEPFEIPPGAFDPETGGIITFDPDNVTLPFVAGTGNREAAVVLDVPGVFPPGSGPVTIILSRAAGNDVKYGPFIPGFQAFEEGYEIISSQQPWDEGPGILVALCAVPGGDPSLPSDAAIGHLHEGEVSLLVPTDPDPQALGYIDCSDVEDTTTPFEAFNGTAPAGPAWTQVARRIVDPVVSLFEPRPLQADVLAFGVAGPGLGGRTKSLSHDAPVDPVIDVAEEIQLQVGTDATWTSDDEGIATVDGTGLVTGVCPGTTHINASFDDQELSIRITVEGEESCGLPVPILEQTGYFPLEVGTEWGLSITNADDYDSGLFVSDSDYGSCAENEGDASRLLLTIYDAGGEVPTPVGFSCSVTSSEDLSDFFYYDEFDDVSQIFVEIYDQDTEETVQSNTISLEIPVLF